MQELRSLDLGNNVLRFDVIKGVIAGDKKWAETHVYSTGGSGYIGPQGGYVQLPTVKSNVSTRHEIWVKEHGSEREFPISLTDTNVKVREGHEVAIVIADTGQHRYFAQLVNRTAQQTYPLLSNFRTFVLEASKLRRVGFLGVAALAVLFAIVIGTAANIAYLNSQQKIEELNNRAKAEAIHVPYDEYARSSENERQILGLKFLAQHQARLLGISLEQRRQMGISGADRKLLEQKTLEQLGIAVPWYYFVNPQASGRPKLNSKQEKALYQLWYGHPDIDDQMADYDKKYREHGNQIGLWIGGALGLIGWLLASYRVNRFTQRLNEAEVKVQTRFSQLANALK